MTPLVADMRILPNYKTLNWQTRGPRLAHLFTDWLCLWLTSLVPPPYTGSLASLEVLWQPQSAVVGHRLPPGSLTTTFPTNGPILTQTLLITPATLNIPLPWHSCPLAHQAGNSCIMRSYLIPMCATLSALQVPRVEAITFGVNLVSQEVTAKAKIEYILFQSNGFSPCCPNSQMCDISLAYKASPINQTWHLSCVTHNRLQIWANYCFHLIVCQQDHT